MDAYSQQMQVNKASLLELLAKLKLVGQEKIVGLMARPLDPYMTAATQFGMIGSGDKQARQQALDSMAMAPGLMGDIVGPVSDAHRFTNDPESRTPGNFALAGLSALPFVPGLLGHTVWHGSPHKWDAPSIDAVGTGEGAQAYGHGFYSAEAPGVAKSYRETLTKRGAYEVDGIPEKEMLVGRSPEIYEIAATEGDDGLKRLLQQADEEIESARKMRWNEDDLIDALDRADRIEELIGKNVKQSEGHLYKLDIPDDDIPKYLDWDKPLSAQSPEVRRALLDFGNQGYENVTDARGWFNETGGNIHFELRKEILEKTNKEVSDINNQLRKLSKIMDQDSVGYRKFRTDKGKDAAKKYDALMEKRAALPDLQWSPEMMQEYVSQQLNSMGIHGIRYLDGSSRNAGEGTYNYVTFDPSRIKVLERK